MGGKTHPATDAGNGGESVVPTEPERRNNHGEPLCDSCGMVVVDRSNSAFGDSCLCNHCQQSLRKRVRDTWSV